MTADPNNESGAPRGEAGDRAGPQVSPPESRTSKTVVYGSLTARDPDDVTRTLFTETGRWVAAEDYERVLAHLEEWQRQCTGKHGSQQKCVDRPAVEPPQAPIARITVDDGIPLSAIMLAPGLPPGTYDLYCEPTERVPPVKTDELCTCRDVVAVNMVCTSCRKPVRTVVPASDLIDLHDKTMEQFKASDPRNCDV